MSRRRQTPGAARQEWYRATHPQINITFRDPAEHYRVPGALLRHHQTAREVLLAWVAGGGTDAPAPPRAPAAAVPTGNPTAAPEAPRHEPPPTPSRARAPATPLTGPAGSRPPLAGSPAPVLPGFPWC